ncbi:hypothetical protein NL676_035155 [Syzygium grande]|nr:hypothetical protein NL676_035155 [Syzygium grande]
MRMNYKMESKVVVTANEILGGIRKLVEEVGNKRRQKVQVSEKSRMALAEGGCSYLSLDRLIEEIFNNMP